MPMTANRIQRSACLQGLLLTVLLFISSCSFFGEKNKVSDYIEKPDYSLKSVEYVPVYPDFGSGIKAVSLCMGYDEILYAVDSAKAISFSSSKRFWSNCSLCEPGFEGHTSIIFFFLRPYFSLNSCVLVLDDPCK